MVKVNSTYRNNDPYEGEGNIMVVSEEDEYGTHECLHVDHVKHPEMNGLIEHKHKDAIINSYHEIE